MREALGRVLSGRRPQPWRRARPYTAVARLLPRAIRGGRDKFEDLSWTGDLASQEVASVPKEQISVQ